MGYLREPADYWADGFDRAADAFDVVVPDMPGYGYSDRPAGTAPDSIAVAGLWAELMSRLGYQRFAAAGGDIGSAVGLNDSPAGLLAWIVEKMRAWSGPDAFSRDEILTNVTIYWLTGTIGSAMRMYRANGAIPPVRHARRVEVPSGFSLFPADLVRPPRAWLDRMANTVRVTEHPRGGHFAPFEQPDVYAAELREFFRPYR